MIDPKRVTPLLTNMSVDREIGRGPNGTVYQVTRRMDGRKLALKHISIPANDAQTKALIYAGAVTDEAGAKAAQGKRRGVDSNWCGKRVDTTFQQGWLLPAERPERREGPKATDGCVWSKQEV